jgi:hypothetical protein
MSFTRFYDDPARIQKQLQQMTDIGYYHLNVPGPGTNLPFLDDPNIRLQKWGANLHTNSIEIDNDFRGLYRPLNRVQVEYKSTAPSTMFTKQYGNQPEYVLSSRDLFPHWKLRDQECKQWMNQYVVEGAKTCPITIPCENNICARER